MADREPFRDRGENRREDNKRGEDRHGAGRRGNDRRDAPRRGDSAPRGGAERGTGRRAPESGDRPRYSQDRSERGSGRPTREGGGFSREGGPRREGGGFSREGGPRREGGGFSREGGQRGRDDRSERGPRKDFGGAGRGADAGSRNKWQDRDGQRGAPRTGRDQERRSYRETGRDDDRRPGRSFSDDRRPSRSYGDAPRGERRAPEHGRRPGRAPRETGTEDAPFTRPHNARDLRSANRPDRERSPEIDEDVTGSELDKVTRAEIRNLEERSALWVAKHLVMAGRLIDDEPELAFQHALAASRRGGRLAVVREAVGLAAYAAGHYGEALREFRTYRRISGSNVHLPVMADCERGLGRPDRALDLARSDDASSLDTAGKVELAIVVSGARTDLGQLDAAVAALEIPQLTKNRAFSYSPRLFRAYADALAAVGRTEEATSWRRQAEVAENALGVGAFEDPDIIDLVGDDEGTELDRSAARGTVQSVGSSPEVRAAPDSDSKDTASGASDSKPESEDESTDEDTVRDENTVRTEDTAPGEDANGEEQRDSE